MSEKIPQSNPEQNEPKMYLIPEANDQLVMGFVTGAREERSVSIQKDGPPLQLRKVEVQYETVGPDGEMTTQKKMVIDHLLTDSVQDEMMQRYQKNKNNTEGEIL